ncbi:DUF3000 domain-containing protein [Sanguibacter sp. YZGR15]|uniref:DUF3000 domain-containing protein n=1 Tax=Sanguibacter suaedae TaxID=2795737 RepID=A0A934ICE6_9MICO|nr:DUF3000 domain-containing protein [Sanguibacter suaedae]
MTADQTEVPEDFLAALRSLRAAQVRPEVRLTEVPAPRRIAPYAAALNGEVASGELERTGHSASGRFIVLHDPRGQDAWEGTYRMVTLVRATLDPEMGADPLLTEVAWSWVEEALARTGAVAHAQGGTVTRVASESFGTLASREQETEVEIRASWSPRGPGGPGAPVDLGPHLAAWANLMCTTTGLPTYPDGVTPLTRGPRGVV